MNQLRNQKLSDLYKGCLRGYKPLCFVSDGLLLSRGMSLYLASEEGTFITKKARIPATIQDIIAEGSRLYGRALRSGVNYALVYDVDKVLVVCKKKFYLLNINTGEITLDHVVERGSRPLMLSLIKDISGFDDMICYGEYWHNAGKESVNILGRNPEGRWKILYTFLFGTIEHIHAIIPDPFRNAVWILTGDKDDSSGFWLAKENFSSVEPIAIGRQEFRACNAFPQSLGLIYATDSQFEKNSIRFLHEGESGWYSECLHPLIGSNIYACQVKDKYIFSTSVEPGALSGTYWRDLLDRKPGPGIQGNSAELVYGNEKVGFKRIATWEKDYWPMRLFQFGTIMFPTAYNPTSKIYAYGLALKRYDDRTLIYEIN